MAITRDLWVVIRARDEASRIVRSFGNNVSNAANSTAANMSVFENQMQRLGLRLQQFAMTSMLAGAAMAGIGAAGLSFIKEAADVAVAYEKQVRATKTQVDDISISLEDLAAVGRRVAREVEVPFEQMQETLFFVFSSMNVTLAESEQLLKGFAKEAVAGQTSIENAARSNIAIMNALNLTTKDLARIQDVQFQVVRKGVITYEELSNTIGRVLPAAARSGQTIETVGAMMAFLTRNGLSAAMAAASAARALESFAHPTTVGRLEDIGIKVRDARGEFLPLLDVMTQMNKKLVEMSQPEKAAFFQELFKGAGGTIQARRFWDVAFKNFDDFQEMMGFMANSAGVFENSYANMADSVAAKSVLLENKWMLVKEALGRAVMPHLLKLMTLLGQVLDWFERLPEPIKNMIGQFILWGSIISIVVGAIVILIGILAFFVSGIMLAGTALVAVLTAIVAVTTSILALGAAIYLAWQNSQGFRNVISDVANVIKSFWKTTVQVASQVQKSFDEKMRPALDRIWNIIETKVIPAVREFIRIWSEEVIPKIEEAARIVKDMVGGIFEYIAYVINNLVIPSINRLTDWWEKHGDAIRPFLAIAGQIVKWLLIIAGAMILAPITAFFTVIAALIIAVMNFVEGIKTVWHFLVALFTTVGQFFKGLGAGIVDFVTRIYKNVAEFLQPLTDLFREVFGLIGDIIIFFTTLITEVINDWIIPVYNFITSKLRDLWRFIQDIWRQIHDTIKDFLNRIFNNVSESTNPFVQKIRETFQETIRIIKDAIKNVIDFFKDAGKWLYNAGKDIVTGLINGITDTIKDLREKLREITQLIPKIKGPKAVDLRLLVPVGKNIMQGFMNGLMSQVPLIKAQLQGVTNQLGGLQAPVFAIPTPVLAGGGGQEKVVNQYITINTQEINPRINAEELGHELGDRL